MLKRTIKKRTTGFTLLELMLVLALISAISVFSIGIYQQQALNFKIDKTALQMQQWLEAAKAYYVDCTAWPGPDGYTAQAELEGQKPSCNGNVTYIQSGAIDTSPWGGAYKLIPPTATNKGFGVQLTLIPSKSVNAPVLAARIAARLPNAQSVITPGSNVVQAYVTIPGQASLNSSQVVVLSVQNIDCVNNTCPQIPEPNPANCPNGMLPTLHLGIEQFSAYSGGSYQAAIGAYQVFPAHYQAGQPWPTNITMTFIGPNGKSLPANGSLLAVITCEMPQTPSTQTAITNAQPSPYRF